jgi:cyclic pyranopterin phosphate synthase
MNAVDYLRISVTDRCNLTCFYCNPGRFLPRKELLSFEEIGDLARAAVDAGIRRVRLTGGEPTMRRDLPRLVELLSSIEGIGDLSLTTNGIRFSAMAEDLRAHGLSRVNISLDTLSPEKFARITGVDMHHRVIGAIDAALAAGLDPVKVNVVAIKGYNDDEVVPLALYASRRGAHLRFIEMMPFQCNRALQKGLFLSAAEILARLEERFVLEECTTNGPGPARYYRMDGGGGTIGLISPFSRPFCTSCNRLRLTSTGILRNCLFADSGVDLRAALRGGASRAECADLIRSSIRAKGKGHRLVHGEPSCAIYSPSQIGG